MASLRGLSANQEQNQQRIIRDTRTLSQKIADFYRSPKHVGLLNACLVAVVLILGWTSDFVILLAIFNFFFSFFRVPKLPFRMPKWSNELDPNDVIPGTAKKKKAGGIYFFGNENQTKNELWFTNDDMRTHVLIFGSTGSGKTQALISLTYNALIQSSGFIYVDGKGDNSLFSSIFSMVRSMGREDDLLLINFMTGARDILGPQTKRLSNTMNPFSVGSSSMLSQLVVSLMPDSSASSDGDMWKGRAISFVEALMALLVPMRDAGYILLDASAVRHYFDLKQLEDIVLDNKFPRRGQDPVSIEGMPDKVTEPLKNYMATLPGFNPEKKGKQVSQVYEQHGYITMQLTRVFGSLADTYGHILRTALPEVDVKDVVLNRRLLNVLLPALEKSPDELANLGKIIIASLRAMMASGLGDAVEGEYKDLVESKPTNSETPFLCILDEYGYYAVKGFAVVPAQARSLGFSVVFAGQDLPAFEKASKEEAASIGANTNIKICMKLEDPKETWEFFMKTAGESYVSQVESFQMDSSSMFNSYMDARGARLEKRSRVDLLDLKNQEPGEGHMFFKSGLVRMRFFYADPKPVKMIRLNHFIEVEPPKDADIIKLKEGFSQFAKLAQSGNWFAGVTLAEDDASKVTEKIKSNANLSPIAAAFAALSESHEAIDPLKWFNDAADDDFKADYVNLFTPMNFSDYLQDVIVVDDMSQFRKPMLDRADVRDAIEYMQRLCGKTPQQSMNVAIELVTDMQNGTQYPPRDRIPTSGPVLANTVNRLIEVITIKKQEAQKT